MPTQTRDTNGQHHAMPHQRLHGFVKGSVSFKIVLLSYYPLNGIFLFKPINIFHKINVELNVFFGKDAQRDLVGLIFCANQNNQFGGPSPLGPPFFHDTWLHQRYQILTHEINTPDYDHHFTLQMVSPTMTRDTHPKLSHLIEKI